MLKFDQMQGAIFDVDDTLLDNGPVDRPAEWLHSRSRYAAVQAVAKERGLEALASLTPEENGLAFTTAAEHSIYGAAWNILFMKGLVSHPEVDRSHATYPLVLEIAERKNELHEPILRRYGREVPGSTKFIKNLVSARPELPLALATTAVRRDVDIHLEKQGLTEYFPDERIVTIERVKRPKPDPEGFELAFQSLGLPDSARPYVAAFEDNDRGFISARHTGLYVCAILTRYRRDDARLLAAAPDLVAETFDEFGRLLEVPGY